MELKKILRSISKRCFVNCFERAMRNNGKLTDNDVLECDPEIRITTGMEISYKALATRRSSIFRIFKNGKQLEALQTCFNAQVDAAIRQKARELHARYCKH